MRRLRDGDQVGRAHVLEGHARLDRVRVLAQRLVDPARQGLRLFGDDLHEALPLGRFHLGKADHVLRGRPDAGHGRAHAGGERLQQLAALQFLSDEARDVLQRKHDAADAPAGGEEERHLHPDQAARRDCGDESRARRSGALVERVLQLVHRVHDLLAIEQAEHRAPEADRRGCRTESGARLLVDRRMCPSALHSRITETDRHERREPVALFLQPRADSAIFASVSPGTPW